jgi:hypothetical protein
MKIFQNLAKALPYSVSCWSLRIAETRILSLNPAGALCGKGFRGFPQASIAKNCHLQGGLLDPDENGGVECLQDKGSRTRLLKLLRKLN